MSYNQKNGYQCVSVEVISKNNAVEEGLCYYAQVNLVSTNPHIKPESKKSLEVILNGSGTNKALKKVAKELTFKGIPIPKNLREITKPYQEHKI